MRGPRPDLALAVRYHNERFHRTRASGVTTKPLANRRQRALTYLVVAEQIELGEAGKMGRGDQRLRAPVADPVVVEFEPFEVAEVG